MNTKNILAVVFTGFLACSVCAEDGDPRETFRKWRIAVGGALNMNVQSHLCVRNVPALAPGYFPGAGMTRQEALDASAARDFGANGYIRHEDPSTDNGWNTENWKLSDSDVAYKGNGRFELDNDYQEKRGSMFGGGHSEHDELQFGLSVEVARELWIHDENDVRRWGVDFAAALSYFFQRNVYSSHGSVLNGAVRTVVDDPDAMYKYGTGEDSAVGGMYGYGNAQATGFAPALTWSSISDPVDLAPGGPRAGLGLHRYSASGDYRELEMLFMFRPWYEIKDWWRVYAQAGVGVCWGRFDGRFYGPGVSAREHSDGWDVYGVAGLGTMFRYGRYDLGIDFLWRFLRDDLDVDGRYLNGEIDRAEWVIRVMLGFEF